MAPLLLLQTYNTPLSIIMRTSREKIRKASVEWYSILKQLDLTENHLME